VFSCSVANALYRLCVSGGARPGEWAEKMAAASRACVDVGEFLQAGKVAAWLSGLAEYRGPALEACSKIPLKPALAVLGLPPGTGEKELAAALDNLRADPWSPISGRPPDREKELKIVARAGSFRGVGGAMARPPPGGLGHRNIPGL
ncbi:MAG TPA: hypothetical protein VLS90_02060, partial [Thermodesulfobacteriota bacterium]|nr:hypothetical protein [Thermodesulfobacteriota bacterium]